MSLLSRQEEFPLQPGITFNRMVICQYPENLQSLTGLLMTYVPLKKSKFYKLPSSASFLGVGFHSVPFLFTALVMSSTKKNTLSNSVHVQEL